MPDTTTPEAPTKGTITPLDGPDRNVFHFLFNPTTYDEARSASWQPQAANGRDVPFIDYTGGTNGRISMTLFFDTFEQRPVNGTPVRNVRDYTDKLAAWLKPTVPTVTSQQDRKRPPILQFQWGERSGFKAVLTDLSLTFTLFHPDGTPARGTAKLTLLEVPDDQPGTNPTSYSKPGYKSRLVMPQDTLALIAYSEYGDAGLWRHIADVNELDDPLNLHPGQLLAIPPLS